MTGRIMPPPPQKDIYLPIPQACEYVTLHGKKYFSDVIKGSDLEMVRLS